MSFARKSEGIVLFIGAMILLSLAANAATIFRDDFNDLTVQTPAFAASGVDWTIESGLFSADAANPTPGFWIPRSGTLMFDQEFAARISVNFGATTTPVEVRFKLANSNANYGGGNQFRFGFRDTVAGKSYSEIALNKPNAWYGTSGFCQWNNDDELVAGTAGYALQDSWNYLKMSFAPATGVKIWQAVDGSSTKAYDDPSLTYALVAQWNNYYYLSNVNQFWLQKLNDDPISWKVDDVVIDGTPTAPFVDAVTFSSDGGEFPSNAFPMSVVVSCATASATIYYTTDGSEPSDTHGTAIVSGASVVLSYASTLNAKAYKAACYPSEIKSASFTSRVFADDWNDATVDSPSFSPYGADWVVESGTWSAAGNILTIDNDGRISANFGATKSGTPTEVRFKLYQMDQDAGGFRFLFGLRDTGSGKFYLEAATPKRNAYDVSGFHSYDGAGDIVAGLSGAKLSTDGNWDYLKFKFTPGVGVEVWQSKYTDSSKTYDELTYTKVASWNDFKSISSMDQFFVERADDAGRWLIDDLEITGSLDVILTPCAAPTFSIPSGAYATAQNVTINCTTPGATIKYTTDGSTPGNTNGTSITPGTSVLVDHTLTLKARALATGYGPSAVVTAPYQFTLAFRDNWDDKTIYGPTYAPAGVDWNIEGGVFSADRSVTGPGFHFVAPVVQGLMFDYTVGSRISVDFGNVVSGHPVEARFKLMQTNGSSTFNTFGFGLKDNNPASASYGYYYQENASVNSSSYGSPSSGFHTMISTGAGPNEWTAGQTDVPGAKLSGTNGQWNYLKMIFDMSQPEDYQVSIWQALSNDKSKGYDDPSLMWQRVAHWGDIMYMENVSQFFLENGNHDLSWAVDDVEVICTPQATPAAVETPAFTPDGGTLTASTSVVINCATSGATIRYTSDGSIPTESTGTVVASGGSVMVSSSLVLTARAFKSGLAPSTSKSASYYFATLNRPTPIPYSNAVTVDGNLADWADATWAPIDQIYDGAPSDIAEAYYAAKWGASGQKVYVAVKVRDTAHFFTNTYTSWDGRDAVELYIHTTGETGDYPNSQEPAQQYVVGITNSNRSQVWAVMGANVAIPTAADFTAAGHEGTGADLGWLFYEVAMTPFQYFGGLVSNPSVISTLSAGQIIGLDVAAVAHNASAYTGMKSENTLGAGKWFDVSKLGQHALAMGYTDIAAAKDSPDGAVACTGTVSAVFTDYLYIESTDRTVGIRVNKTAHGRSVGQNVNVIGSVGNLTTGERYINASDVSLASGSGNILPLAMTNKGLGGATRGLQSGVAGGIGLNNIGLLVRVSGRVGAKGTGWFMLDDGSGVSVKVYGTAPTGTPYVVVTGASSCEKDGSLNIQRVIQAASIVVL